MTDQQKQDIENRLKELEKKNVRDLTGSDLQEYNELVNIWTSEMLIHG